MIDDEILIKEIGISLELTEHSQIDSVVYNDKNSKISFDWSICLHPPIDRKDIMYFQIYDNKLNNGPVMCSTSKIARISMLEPDYIHCSDCSKPEWILNKEERDHLIYLLSDPILWDNIKYSYMSESKNGGNDIPDISNLKMPDYSKLPIV